MEETRRRLADIDPTCSKRQHVDLTQTTAADVVHPHRIQRRHGKIISQ